MRSLDDHLYKKGKKRILSLDGGGVRGLITLGILARVETVLADRYAAHYQAQGKTRDDFRLCDYFDLIGGTSTGGIIAAMLALGYKVEEIRDTYLDMCPEVFVKGRRGGLESWFNPYGLLAPRFDGAKFQKVIERIVDKTTARYGRPAQDRPRLDSDLLRTGLALVMKRVDSGSVWALTNNSQMRWWDPESPHWPHANFRANREFDLGTLVRATASAPFLLDAVSLTVAPPANGVPEENGVFLDGAASPFNNPALELFLMTTLKSYAEDPSRNRFSPFGFDWDTGEDQLLLYSVGTGGFRERITAEAYQNKRNWEQAKIALLSIIGDGMKSSLTWLQAMSEPRNPYHVDGNLGDMRDLRFSRPKLLTFRRVNFELTEDVVSRLLGEKITPGILDRLRQLDNADTANLKRLAQLGKRAGEVLVDPEDLPSAFDPFGPTAATIPGANVMFTVTPSAKQGHALRLVADAPLTAADFEAVAKALSAAPVAAHKSGLIAARQSERKEVVETMWNGKETSNAAKPGDWIVVNLDAQGTPLLDRNGHLNRYVIANEKFDSMYKRTGGANEHGDLFRAQGQVRALRLPGGFDLVAPWGERQKSDDGYLLLNDGEVYGNHFETFEKTYEITAGT